LENALIIPLRDRIVPEAIHSRASAQIIFPGVAGPGHPRLENAGAVSRPPGAASPVRANQAAAAPSPRRGLLVRGLNGFVDAAGLLARRAAVIGGIGNAGAVDVPVGLGALAQIIHPVRM